MNNFTDTDFLSDCMRPFNPDNYLLYTLQYNGLPLLLYINRRFEGAGATRETVIYKNLGQTKTNHSVQVANIVLALINVNRFSYISNYVTMVCMRTLDPNDMPSPRQSNLHATMDTHGLLVYCHEYCYLCIYVPWNECFISIRTSVSVYSCHTISIMSSEGTET